MFRPGLEPGPPAWEASTLEKSHLDSLYTGYSEPLLMMRLASLQTSTWLPQCKCIAHGLLSVEGMPEGTLKVQASTGLTVIQTAPTVMYDNHVGVTTITRPDQGHRFTLLEVPGLTCPGRARPGPPAWEASTLEKSHLDSLYTGYSEPLLMMRLASLQNSTPGMLCTVLSPLIYLKVWKKLYL